MLCICMLLPFYNVCTAQQHTLKEVKINATKPIFNDIKLNKFTDGMKVVSVDSNILQENYFKNIGQMLSSQFPVFVKSYGINSIATLNFRGSSAAQSQVYWNGIPINSATSGLSDVSTLGVSNFDNVHILYGSSSALLGSGNVGAALLLQNDFGIIEDSIKWHHIISSEVGSYGQIKWSLQEKFKYKKFFSSIKYNHQHVKNNFKFQNLKKQWEELPNATLNSYSLMSNSAYHFNNLSQIKLSIWWQQINRQIPPALFETYSVKNQIDNALRTSAKWDLYSKNYRHYFSNNVAYINELMKYNDTSVNIQSQTLSHQIYNEFTWKYLIDNRQDIMVFAPISIAWLRPSNDSNIKYQNKVALAMTYSKHMLQNKLKTSINTRIEQIDNKSIFLVGLNCSYVILSTLKLRANVQNTFRAPSLNELYYVPGGNINLSPEKGWNIDGGYQFEQKIHNSKLILNHELLAFSRNIKDWIIWFGGSIWTPHNIAQVYSRGLETYNTLQINNHRYSIKLNFNGAYTIATTQHSYMPNDGSIGKQIPYSPSFLMQGGIEFSYLTFRFKYLYNYTGIRYTTTDESNSLNAYSLSSLYLSKRFKIDKKGRYCLIQSSVHNIFNAKYQVVQQRPMPYRNWTLGILWYL